MCLAIPGKVVAIENADKEKPRMATVDFGGVVRTICIDWVDVQTGEYILAHAGIALTAMKRTKEALAAYDEAIRLEPALAEAYFNRALLLMEGASSEADRTRAFADLSRAGELGIPQAYSLIKMFSK